MINIEKENNDNVIIYTERFKIFLEQAKTYEDETLYHVTVKKNNNEDITRYLRKDSIARYYKNKGYATLRTSNIDGIALELISNVRAGEYDEKIYLL